MTYMHPNMFSDSIMFLNSCKDVEMAPNIVLDVQDQEFKCTGLSALLGMCGQAGQISVLERIYV